MKIKEILHKEIDSLPDVFAGEVLDFVQFVKSKHQKEKYEMAIMSEKSLGKEWLSAEEDEAWQDL